MENTGHQIAIAALRDKRARIAGEITRLSKQMKSYQQHLKNLDATLRIFDEGCAPEAIRPKRTYERFRLFKPGQLGRTILSVLRKAARPLPVADVVSGVMAESGHSEEHRAAIDPRVRANLDYLRKGGKVSREDVGQAAMWALIG